MCTTSGYFAWYAHLLNVYAYFLLYIIYSMLISCILLLDILSFAHFHKYVCLIYSSFSHFLGFLCSLFAQCAQYVLNIKLRSEKIIKLYKSWIKKCWIDNFIPCLCNISRNMFWNKSRITWKSNCGHVELSEIPVSQHLRDRDSIQFCIWITWKCSCHRNTLLSWYCVPGPLELGETWGFLSLRSTQPNFFFLILGLPQGKPSKSTTTTAFPPCRLGCQPGTHCFRFRPWWAIWGGLTTEIHLQQISNFPSVHPPQLKQCVLEFLTLEVA